MREIGGYIELDRYRGEMLHSDGVLLNCGRACLKYLIRARGIKRIVLPYFCCETVGEACEQEHVSIRYAHIDNDWKPEDVRLDDDEWLYVVDCYGQLDRAYVVELKQRYDRLIIDEAQNYFAEPVDGVDTIYTCRKFFGVADGAILYTDAELDEELPIDESFERMRFLLGRFERTANEFYGEYVENNAMFADEPVKRMSKLTQNLLHGVDYKFVSARRTENFERLHEAFEGVNQLTLTVPRGAFAYPLMLDNGAEIRRKLIEQKIYIPKLWSGVPTDCREHRLADNILPLPVDQRYDGDDMSYLINSVKSLIGGH